MHTVFMFPGQGAQNVGMGKELAKIDPEIEAIYRDASDILGYDIATLCFEGPEENLNKTEISQPAIFVTSVACLKALHEGKLAPELAGVTADAFAGLSLGEYTALHAAGTLDFESALKLVQIRGQSMQEAAEMSEGTMVSILGIDESQAEELAEAVLAENIDEGNGLAPVLAPVNFNCPGQIVFSGSIQACRRAEERAGEFGSSRAIPLKVAGAFHTEIMAPAADKLGQALKSTNFLPFDLPVVANVDANWYAGTEEIPDKLLRQLVQPVRWQQSIEFLLEQGAERFIEIGPGRVLTGLAKKIFRPRKVKKTIETVSA